MVKTQTYSGTDRNYNTIYREPLTPGEAIRATLLNRISWGAVLAGVVMGFAVHIVLNLLGVGVGLASMDSLTGPGVSNTEISLGAIIWWVAAGVVAAYIGGFTAGRLAGEPKVSTSAWHGLISWAASVLVVTVLMMSAAGAASNIGLGGPMRIVMDQSTVTISPATSAVSGYAIDETSTPGTTAQTFTGSTGETGAGGSTRMTVSADMLATASLAGAIALILSAIAAWFGGRLGTVRALDLTERRADSIH